jgi:hypothetical protein
VAKERVRETERSNQSDRRRTREKDRRREYDDKYSRRSYVEDATDSDSDDTEVYYGNKQGGDSRKRHEEVRRKREWFQKHREGPDHSETRPTWMNGIVRL